MKVGKTLCATGGRRISFQARGSNLARGATLGSSRLAQLAPKVLNQNAQVSGKSGEHQDLGFELNRARCRSDALGPG